MLHCSFPIGSKRAARVFCIIQKVPKSLKKAALNGGAALSVQCELETCIGGFTFT